MLEVAARPIGGLCSRVLRFVQSRQPPALAPISLEELLLRHAVGEDVAGWGREPQAAAVMMIPIPRARPSTAASTGRSVARAVPGVDDVRITAKPDQLLEPLPEAGSYLGFIFARAADAGRATQAPCASAHALHCRSSSTPRSASGRDLTRATFACAGDVAGRQRRAFAEEEVLHVLRDQLLGLFLPGHQPVLVEDHLHALFPELPGLGRDVLEDPLAQLAGPGRCLQAGQFLLELHAEHRAARGVAGRRRGGRRIAGSHGAILAEPNIGIGGASRKTLAV